MRYGGNGGNGGNGTTILKWWKWWEMVAKWWKLVETREREFELTPPMYAFIGLMELEWNWWNRAKFVGCWGQWQHRWRQHQQQRLWHHQ